MNEKEKLEKTKRRLRKKVGNSKVLDIKEINKKLVDALLYLNKIKKDNEVVIAISVSKEKFEILGFYSAKKQDSFYALDTFITNLMLQVCNNYGELFFISTCEPTNFEKEAIKIIGIRQIIYSLNDKIILLENDIHNRKLIEKELKSNQIDYQNNKVFFDAIAKKLEENKMTERPKLLTQDAFLWIDELKLNDLSEEEKKISNEFYISLLYSSLFILWNDTARQSKHLGGLPVAAMLVNVNFKPIAFSVNTRKADNSMAHAELGMLFRYFQNTKKNALPENTTLYTTLESCEMCRAGLNSVKGVGEFKEIHGKKDKEVKCDLLANYNLSEHTPTSNHLKNIKCDSKDEFYNFCKTNYLLINYFLKQPILKLKYSSLFNNSSKILEQILNMRINPWVGNPILYDLQEDSTDSNYYHVKQKKNFKELYKKYYGDDIEKFEFSAKEFKVSYATIQSDESIQIGNLLRAQNGAKTTLINTRLLSDTDLILRIPKNDIHNRIGIITGHNPLNIIVDLFDKKTMDSIKKFSEKGHIGKFDIKKPIFEKMRNILFPETQKILKKEANIIRNSRSFLLWVIKEKTPSIYKHNQAKKICLNLVFPNQKL